jgi:hypothetical protein
MDDIRARLEDVGDFLAETGEVGGQDGWGNPGCVHDRGSL